MAAGNTHDRTTYAMLVPVYLLAWLGFKFSMYASLLIALGFWVGGIYLSPDLDTRSKPFYRWGFFRFIWWPYQWAIRHRSAWSHGIFTGPLLRVAYLSAILILLYFGFRLYVHQAPSVLLPQQEVVHFLQARSPDLLTLASGIWLGSLLHILLDHLPHRLKLPKL